MHPKQPPTNGTRLTIGELARRTGLRTSALRFYEEQDLLSPVERTEAGYRLYSPESERTAQFIQRAQRLGFSLADIRLMLHDLQDGTLSHEAVAAIAQERFLELERKLTELLVLRHEMRLFLADLNRDGAHQPTFERLLGRICMGPPAKLSANTILDWLLEQTHCVLRTPDGQTLLEALYGQHIHVWQEEDAYHILVTGHDPIVEASLRELAALEAQCHAHAAPQFRIDDEGYLFVLQGENAFIFAQLFLALEQESRQ